MGSGKRRGLRILESRTEGQRGEEREKGGGEGRNQMTDEQGTEGGERRQRKGVP